MDDDMCVNINEEIQDALGSMNNGLFQGMNLSSQNPWTMGFAAMLLVMFLVVTFAQIRQRQKITTEKQSMDVPANRNTEI